MRLFQIQHIHTLDEETKALLRGVIRNQRHLEDVIMGLKEDMQSALADLATEVQANTNTEQSAAQALQSLAAQLTSQIDAGATIAQIRGSISAIHDASGVLASAIAATSGAGSTASSTTATPPASSGATDTAGASTASGGTDAASGSAAAAAPADQSAAQAAPAQA